LIVAETKGGIEFDAEHPGDEGGASEEAAHSIGELWGSGFENITDHFPRTTSNPQSRRPRCLKVSPPLATLCVGNQDDDRVPLIVIANGESEELPAAPTP
jgi:hypothetical protein